MHNMKNLTTLLILTFVQFTTWAQTTEIITGLTEPTSIAKVGNIIYSGEFNGNLVKFDITDIDAGTTNITNTNGIYRCTVQDDNLYYTELYNSQISTIDATKDNPEPRAIIEGLELPIGIASDDEYIYFSDYTPSNDTKIMRFLSDDPSTLEEIYSEVGPTALCKEGNTLYYVEDETNTVRKFDVTISPVEVEVVATGFQNPTSIVCDDEKLIVADFEAGNVVSIDLTSPDNPKTNILTDIAGPTGMFLEGNNLYISVYYENKIIMHTLASPLNVSSIENLNMQIYPNPTIDYLHISDWDKESNYEIIDLSGRIVQTGIVNNTEHIDVIHLVPGTYHMLLDETLSTRFVKN